VFSRLETAGGWSAAAHGAVAAGAAATAVFRCEGLSGGLDEGRMSFMGSRGNLPRSWLGRRSSRGGQRRVAGPAELGRRRRGAARREAGAGALTGGAARQRVAGAGDGVARGEARRE
jgi:hypothetical protein